MNTVELIYKNIVKMSNKKFDEYIKTITREEAQDFKKDLFDNGKLNKFIDIGRLMRCMKVADIVEKK